jgi:hypothetical protein
MEQSRDIQALCWLPMMAILCIYFFSFFNSKVEANFSSTYAPLRTWRWEDVRRKGKNSQGAKRAASIQGRLLHWSMEWVTLLSRSWNAERGQEIGSQVHMLTLGNSRLGKVAECDFETPGQFLIPHLIFLWDPQKNDVYPVGSQVWTWAFQSTDY